MTYTKALRHCWFNIDDGEYIFTYLRVRLINLALFERATVFAAGLLSAQWQGESGRWFNIGVGSSSVAIGQLLFRLGRMRWGKSRASTCALQVHSAQCFSRAIAKSHFTPDRPRDWLSARQSWSASRSPWPREIAFHSSWTLKLIRFRGRKPWRLRKAFRTWYDFFSSANQSSTF